MPKIRTLILAALFISLSATAFPAGNDDAELLKIRRSVWLVWLANDQEALKRLVPDDTVVISAGETK